jgi:hypothetical protein
MRTLTHKKLALTLAIFLVTLTLYPFSARNVEAASLSTLIVRPDRMAISVSTSYLIIFKVATANATKIVVSFPAGYDVTGVAATTTGVPTTYNGTSITNFPNLGTATVSSQDVTIPATSGTLSNSATYGVYLTTVVNPGSTGQKDFTVVSKDSGGTTLDTASAENYVVTDNGASTDADQIVVTASVSPSFTLDLSGNADSVTTALNSVASGTGVTATVTTNAQAGYAVFLKSGSSAGLHSTTTGTSIAFSGTAADDAPTTLSSGTEGVVVDVDSTTNTSGALTIADEFNGSTTSAGGTPSTTYQQIFSSNAPVGGAGDVATIIPRVAISATTKAATDYTQTFTVTGAGTF